MKAEFLWGKDPLLEGQFLARTGKFLLHVRVGGELTIWEVHRSSGGLVSRGFAEDPEDAKRAAERSAHIAAMRYR